MLGLVPRANFPPEVWKLTCLAYPLYGFQILGSEVQLRAVAIQGVRASGARIRGTGIKAKLADRCDTRYLNLRLERVTRELRLERGAGQAVSADAASRAVGFGMRVMLSSW